MKSCTPSSTKLARASQIFLVRSYRSIRVKPKQGFQRVMDTIDSLDDRELLDVGVFLWAGKYPISRWVSINTTRQYLTARKFIRRALRENRG